MNTHYTKDDVVELASVIFINDINSDAVAESGMPTDQIAEASFYAAEVFFMKAAAYHRGELDLVLGACHNRGEAKETEERRAAGDRRQGERRGADKPEVPEESELPGRLTPEAFVEAFVAKHGRVPQLPDLLIYAVLGEDL